MKTATVFHLVSLLVLIIGIGMLCSVPAAVVMGDSQTDIWKLAGCAVFCCVASIAGMIVTKPKRGRRISTGLRDGFAAVGIAWVAAVIFGALPFFLTGMSLADSIFEAASGFSTTGASVIDTTTVLRSGGSFVNGVESLPHGILFWRSLTNWLGGIGIVMFAILLLPLLGVGGQLLYNAEVPGIKTAEDQFTPRLASFAKIILLVYAGLTGIETVLLKVCGMDWFDALCHSFTTIATGGFSTKQASLAAYPSAAVQWIVILFMFISACNFTLSIKMFTNRKIMHFKDGEFKCFFGAVVFTILVTAVLLYRMPGNSIQTSGGYEVAKNVESCLRFAAFQIVSLSSTTGFTTADYTLWPVGAGMLILALMLIGGCGGSTSGGMKAARAIVVIKHSFSEIRRCIFPRSIPDVRLNGQRLDTAIVNKTLAFVTLYLLIMLIVAILIAFLSGIDLITSLGSSLTCISNVGPAFGKVGPAYTFAWYPDSAKYLLSLTMIIGRLELYTFLVILLPSFWKK